MKPVKKKIGRPRFPAGTAKDAKLTVRVTDATREAWDRYVEALGSTSSDALTEMINLHIREAHHAGK